jgi:demethylmenaquinone methyltransferase / 2-methoxy-6-polyprenyl-1,4-benzoquinol methylase
MEEKKNKVKRIFDSIAVRYDLLNHLLSFGIDQYWRKKALRLTELNPQSILLDVACGTGDVAITAKKMGVKNIFGADYSHNMLTLFQMVAEYIPVKEEYITNITVAFGVRNFYDIQKAFDSFYTILKSGGKATIIEFAMPTNKVFRFAYKFYFKRILPFIGGLISGDKEAYKYLPASVEEFDEKIKLPELLNNSGFRKIEIYNLTFGITQVVIAVK